jgi:hypothetical protein
MKITSLTQAQTNRFPEFVKRWTEIGLCQQPADRPAAEAAIRHMYEISGRRAPRRIVWCGSPLSQGITRFVVQKHGIEIGKKVWASVGALVWASVGASVGDSVWASVRDSVWASVRDSVWASVGDSVWASVRDSVGDSVGASVWASVWASVGASVGDSVGASVGDSVWASVGDSVRDSVRDSCFGQHEANWLAFYDFFREVCGLTEETKKLDGLWQLSRSAGWALPHENICWVSERHHVLNRDERGRLHSLDAPACAYPDGFAIYAVHGVRVSENVIMRPETLTTKQIESERNTEIRRVMIDKYNAKDKGRYIRDSGAKKLHSDRFGVLWRKEVPDDEPLVMIQLLNSTPESDGTLTAEEAAQKFDAQVAVCHDGMMMPLVQAPRSLRFKEYWLRVPPDMRRAHDAAAWINHKTATEYDPLFQS